MGRYVIRRLLQMIPVFFGVTFIMYFLMFALGRPDQEPGRGQAEEPRLRGVPHGAVQPRRPVHRPVPEVPAGASSPATSGRRSPASRSRRSSSSGGPVTLTLGLTAFVIEIVLGISDRRHRRPAQGRQSSTTLSLASTLVVISIPVFVLGLRGPVRLRREARLVPAGGHRRRMADQLHHAGVRAGGAVAGLRAATHALQAPRDLRRGLHAHRQGQGPARTARSCASTGCATR